MTKPGARDQTYLLDRRSRRNEAASRAVAPLVGCGLVVRRLRVDRREVVFLKGVLEASEGLASMFAESGGELTVATTPSQETELDRVLSDLTVETGALLEAQSAPG